MKATQYNNTHEKALAYAAADRTDPFVYSRIMSHIASGLCDDRQGTADDCRYSAEAYLETRRLPPTETNPDGVEYKVTAYKNMRRP